MPKRLLAIGPAFRIHLQEAEINTQLNLLSAILGLEPPDDHLARLVFPILQQSRNVEVHAANMIVCPQQVNGRKKRTTSGTTPPGARAFFWIRESGKPCPGPLCRRRFFVIVGVFVG
jgi:hypothetical protein